MAAAIATIENNDYYAENSRRIQENRAYTAGELEKLREQCLAEDEKAVKIWK